MMYWFSWGNKTWFYCFASLVSKFLIVNKALFPEKGWSVSSSWSPSDELRGNQPRPGCFLAVSSALTRGCEEKRAALMGFMDQHEWTSCTAWRLLDKHQHRRQGGQRAVRLCVCAFVRTHTQLWKTDTSSDAGRFTPPFLAPALLEKISHLQLTEVWTPSETRGRHRSRLQSTQSTDW